MTRDMEHFLVSKWAKVGVLFNVLPSRETPDVERLICDTATFIPRNPRLLGAAAGWLVRHGLIVARHRLARLAGEVGDPVTRAVLGLLLDTARSAGRASGLGLAISHCRPAPKPMPLILAHRSSPAAADFAHETASRISKHWRLWAGEVGPRPRVLRPTAWVLERNPSFAVRALLRGGLRASVLATLEYDRPEGASEAELARLCLVTRKAVHEAVDHLEFCGLVLRRREGRSYRVTMRKGAKRATQSWEFVMTRKSQKLLRDAMSLPIKDRAAIAHRLIQTLDGPPDRDVEAAWKKEIDRRIKKCDSGQTKSVRWETLRDRLRKGARATA